MEWRPLAELGAVAAEWWALAARALEPNVFYEPAFARAAAPVFGREAGAGLVWSRGTPPRLLGLFPGADRAPALWRSAAGPDRLDASLSARSARRWSSATPSEPVIAAWLDHVARDAQLPKLMLLPYVPEDGAWAQAFGNVARRGAAAA